MNLYLLELPTGQVDCAVGFVIAAPSEIQARSIAASRCGDEGSQPWLSHDETSCSLIGTSTPKRRKHGVILRSFNAG